MRMLESQRRPLKLRGSHEARPRKEGPCVKSEKFGEENEAAEGLRPVVVAEDRGYWGYGGDQAARGSGGEETGKVLASGPEGDRRLGGQFSEGTRGGALFGGVRLGARPG